MITNSSIGSYGRLGNQMFQYAFLVGSCCRHGRRASINKDVHGFDLHHLDIAANGLVEVLSRRDYSAAYEREIVASWWERTWAYSEITANGADGCDYFGYFQSGRYFATCESEIRSAFRFRDSLPASAATWSQIIETSSSAVVGVHVRIGDYLKMAGIHTNLHRTDYYDLARDVLESRLGSSFTALIFSDDIALCQSSGLFANWRDVRFVDGLTHVEDFHLLSRCRHHVIANSSFSWWGAWLAAHPSQLVIAPQQWFGPASPYPEWESIYQNDWIRLPSQRPSTMSF